MLQREKTARKFLNLITSGNYKEAFAITQKTWADKRKAEDLKNLFKDNEVTGFTIKGWTNISSIAVKVHAEIETAKGLHLADINIIRESWPGKPDPFGDWGINPVSVLKPLEEPKPEPKPEPLKNQGGEPVKGSHEVPGPSSSPAPKKPQAKKPQAKRTTKKSGGNNASKK